MKYQVTAAKDNMRVRFFLKALDLREAVASAGEYIKEQTDIEVPALTQFDVYQIDKEAASATKGETEEDDANQTDMPGTRAADVDPGGKGVARPQLAGGARAGK